MNLVELLLCGAAGEWLDRTSTERIDPDLKMFDMFCAATLVQRYQEPGSNPVNDMMRDPWFWLVYPKWTRNRTSQIFKAFPEPS